MTAILVDQMGFEVHRCALKVPPPDIIIWGESGYLRFRGLETKPHEKYYRRHSTQIILDTPASGVYSRRDLHGPTQ